MSLFLSSPFQLIDEDPEKWWYTTIVRRAVTELIHALSTNWGCFCCHLQFKYSMKILTNDDIHQSYRIQSCYLNTSHPVDKLRCRFYCHLHFKQSMKTLTIDDIQQSHIKLLLKHFIFFWQIEVSLFLSSPFQFIDEDPHSWYYSTIVYKAVTKALHAVWTNWGVAFLVISVSNNRWRSWQLMIYNNRI